jgi:flagellar M-ring protein FliF
VQQLVEDAIGYNAQRGDTVKVVNMPFTTQSAATALPWWQQSWFLTLMNSGLRYLVLLILALLLYVGVVRPLLRRRLQQEPVMNTEGSAGEAASAEDKRPATPGVGVPSATLAGASHGPVALPENPLETDLYVARQLVMQDPARAAQVVKEWLANDREAGS